MSKTKLTLLTALLVLMVVSLTVLVPSGAVTDEAISRYEDALWEQEEDEEEWHYMSLEQQLYEVGMSMRDFL